jgi:hypothetical protein
MFGSCKNRKGEPVSISNPLLVEPWCVREPELNGRPRQTLGFKTPSQALAEALR